MISKEVENHNPSSGRDNSGRLGACWGTCDIIGLTSWQMSMHEEHQYKKWYKILRSFRFIYVIWSQNVLAKESCTGRTNIPGFFWKPQEQTAKHTTGIHTVDIATTECVKILNVLSRWKIGCLHYGGLNDDKLDVAKLSIEIHASEDSGFQRCCLVSRPAGSRQRLRLYCLVNPDTGQAVDGRTRPFQWCARSWRVQCIHLAINILHQIS